METTQMMKKRAKKMKTKMETDGRDERVSKWNISPSLSNHFFSSGKELYFVSALLFLLGHLETSEIYTIMWG
jgi:hypothetical protein